MRLEPTIEIATKVVERQLQSFLGSSEVLLKGLDLHREEPFTKLKTGVGHADGQIDQPSPEAKYR